MSTPCEEIRPELEALLGLLAENKLDASGRRRLSTLLNEHPDARQFYLDYCQMHALLVSAHGLLRALEDPSTARRARWAWLGLAAAILVAATAFLLFPLAPRFRASVASVRGSAWAVRNGQRLPLSDGGGVREGDRIVTEADTRTEFQLPDGSKVTLADRSELRLDVGRFELASGSLRCAIAPQPPGRTLVFSTPQAEATVLGTAFELAVEGNETRLYTLEGRVRFTSEGQSVEVGPGEKAAAAAGKILRWTPVCNLDFSKTQKLPAQMEPVFCSSRLLHTKERKVEAAPDRIRFVEGGLVLGVAPESKLEHGLVVARWKEDVGDDVILEADLAGGERWSLGFAVSGDSFEGYRIIFATPSYPNGIAVDTIHPVECVVLASDPRQIAFEKDHLLRVEKRGKHMKVWVDRELRIDTEIGHSLPEGRKRVFAISNFGAPPIVHALRAWKPAP